MKSATAAVAHLAATTAADDLLATSFFNDWTVEHVAPAVRPVSVGGRGRAPRLPGLGVEVDETMFAKVNADPKRQFKWPHPTYQDGSVRDY